MVDRLKERGWVRRESPRGNRRTINVIITLDGRRAYVRNNQTFTVAVEQAVSARLSDTSRPHSPRCSAGREQVPRLARHQAALHWTE